MFQDYFKDSEWLSLPLIALVFFFTFFIAVLARVAFGMRNRSELERIAALPLADDAHAGTREDSNHG